MEVKKVTEIFAAKGRTFSFEFFPPKTEAGRGRLYAVAADLAALGADFFSVTYGAGGSSNVATLEIATELQRRLGVPVVHHLTCIKQTVDDLRAALRRMKESGIRNVLAMRGDPPIDEPDYTPGPEELRFGYELVKVCREFGDVFAAGVPGFPEGHALTPTKALDSAYLRVKQDAGAAFVITQLFFENSHYYEYLDRCDKAGVTIRLIPGILPITDYGKLVTFCRTCHATLPKWIHETFEPIADDPRATYEKGIDVVTTQCKDLLNHGAPGLHFFCLNRTEPAATIYGNLAL